ncbi:MAG: C1 family peptidase [Nitrospirota bacterium]
MAAKHRSASARSRSRPARAAARGARSRVETPPSSGQRTGRLLDAFPDRVDVRDWFYQPRLIPLPDQLINCDLVPEILDQGAEGACTGYALAAVINFLLHQRKVVRRVSPRMLYELARRYDEWPGEQYEGSSARGTMKGWVRHGVCAERSWPKDRRGVHHFTPEIATEALATPGGAYYRVMHRQVRDMHAALNEVGILYATLMVHGGWDRPGPRTVKLSYRSGGMVRQRELPVIARKGRADSGHAVAIVGYTGQGFIVQNSWGRKWGADGFALLPYEDYLLHATDVWVAQLGVPVAVDLWAAGETDTTEGMQRASQAIPLATIRPFVIDVGNNGELSTSGSYWTTEQDLARLFEAVIPGATRTWSKRRVLLYLHGGLNDEQAVARRIVAFRDVLLANEIYPLHVMWESGIVEALSGMIRDLFTDVDERAGAAEWMHRLRDGLLEAKDRSVELTAAVPGTALWNEMKENARLASEHPAKRGGMQMLARHGQAALKRAGESERRRWELHVVGHSAGSIFAAHALPHLIGLGVPVKSVHFMAPAITVALFKRLVLPFIREGRCPVPSLFLLGDEAERSDSVGPYGNSLLYLVSNAFEGRRGVPILGMEKFLGADEEVHRLVQRSVGGLPALVIAGRGQGAASMSRSTTHEGFDNDPFTLNSILRRILGGEPARAFTARDVQY